MQLAHATVRAWGNDEALAKGGGAEGGAPVPRFQGSESAPLGSSTPARVQGAARCAGQAQRCRCLSQPNLACPSCPGGASPTCSQNDAQLRVGLAVPQRHLHPGRAPAHRQRGWAVVHARHGVPADVLPAATSLPCRPSQPAHAMHTKPAVRPVHRAAAQGAEGAGTACNTQARTSVATVSFITAGTSASTPAAASSARSAATTSWPIR